MNHVQVSRYLTCLPRQDCLLCDHICNYEVTLGKLIVPLCLSHLGALRAALEAREKQQVLENIGRTICIDEHGHQGIF